MLTNRLSYMIVTVISLLVPLAETQAAPKIYRYEDTTSSAIGVVTNGGGGDSACQNGTGNTLTRNIAVSDSFTVSSIALGLNITHAERGDLRVHLVAPNGAQTNVITQGSDTDDNFDILISEGFDDDDGESVRPNLDDNDADPVGEPYYVRLVENTNINFYTGNANGTWRIRICDRDNNSVNGTLNQVKLILTENTSVTQSTCTDRVTYNWGANGDNAVFSSTTIGGVTMTGSRAASLGGSGLTGNLRTETSTLSTHAGYFQFFVDAPTVGGAAANRIEQIGQMSEFTFSTEVNDLSFDILDNDWADGDFEDYTVVAAYDAAGNYVPWEYTGNSANQRAGDVVEGDVTAADTGTTGNLGVKFSRAVKRVLIDYLVGDDFESDTLPDDQRTGISDFSFCGFDYGDAPTSYNVNLSGNGPRHVLKNRQLRMGANAPDGETDSNGNTNANLDGSDEDGVSSWPTYVASAMTCSGFTTPANHYCVSVNVTNTSGTAAQLVGWIDFNGDGDFLDAGERSLPRLRNTGGVAGADDTTFTTGNIPTGTNSATRVLVWNSFGVPVNTSTATYARLRLTSDATFFSDSSPQPNGLAADGEVEDYLLPAGTLPVSLASVRSSLGADGVRIEFATLAEAGNLGFAIKGASDRALSPPIAAADQGVNGADYEVHVPAGNFDEFWIEDIALDGRRTAHGPFKVGQAYGTEVDANTDRIDWRTIRADMAAQSQRAAKANANDVLLGANGAGIQRISFADLSAGGLALNQGVPSSKLALTDAGRPVPVFVDDGLDGVFGPGDHIEFVAQRTENRYSDQNWYQLSLTGSANTPEPLPMVRSARPIVVPARFVQEFDRRFNLSIAGDSPWVDDQLLAYDRPVALTRNFVLPAMVPLTPITAHVTVIGGTDLAVEGPDHSVAVAINNTHRVSRTFDGPRSEVLSIEIPAGLLPGQHELSVGIAADLGLPYDLVHYDRLAVDYLSYTFAVDGRFEGRFEAGSGFALNGFDGAGSVWALDAKGRAYHHAFHGNGPVLLGNPAQGVELTWIAARHDRTTKPTVAIRANPASLPNANFLVIAHPSLLNAASDYVNLQRSRGFRVALVGTDTIYAQYSDFEASAEAISTFIRDTNASSPLQFVTLIGADTYDYRNLLGLGSVSFVPTHYVKTSAYIAQTPSDTRHADVDRDGVPDLALGRIPARSPEELLRMTRKITQLGERRLDTALFVAGSDSSGAKRFGGLSLDFATGLPAGTRSELIQLDEYGRNDVRRAVLDGFNRGTTLISYTGHTAPGLWDFSGLLFAQDAAQMTNGGAPSLVTQWGCWNSYFVDPYAQGLSHNLLAAEGGAGTIYGATTLTDDASHALLGQLFFDAVGAGARTLGEAELIAKRRLAELRPEAQDALLGMQILGDPALPLTAP